MSLQLFQEQVYDFFDRSDESFIFPFPQKGDVCLENIDPSPDNTQYSLKAMKDLNKAIIHLRINHITPCQIKNSYVVQKNGVWGLKHVIVQRSSQQQTSEDSYNPEEYPYHSNEENQLMWNLGKIWLRFFTKTIIRIKYHNQQKINGLIDGVVADSDTNDMLKKLLCWNHRNRISFDDYLCQKIFVDKQDPQQLFITSYLSHMKTMFSLGLMESTKGMNTFDIMNPFVKEIHYRVFLEYLDVDYLIENTITAIRNQYSGGSTDQKSKCQFSLYMISLQNYMNMVEINNQRLEIGQRFQELEHRLYYTRFAKRMVSLRAYLEKTANKLSKNPCLSADLKEFTCSLDNLKRDSVYYQFKSCLSEYATFLKKDLKETMQRDIETLRLLLKIYIVRTSRYIFLEGRKDVFKAFLFEGEEFKIRTVLKRINECQNYDRLKKVLIVIQEFYFK